MPLRDTRGKTKMPLNSRTKGKVGERELRDKIREHGFDAFRGQQYCGLRGNGDVVSPELPVHCAAATSSRHNRMEPPNSLTRWTTLMNICQTDETMTRVVHWRKFQDEASSAKRTTVIRSLRRQHLWSVSEIAATLGLSRRIVFVKLRGIASSTTGLLATPTSPTTPAASTQSRLSLKPSMKTKGARLIQSP
jgi:hypothetical protein